MGCFIDDVNRKIAFNSSAKQRNQSTSSCILRCDELEHPLAFADDVSCACGRFSKT